MSPLDNPTTSSITRKLLPLGRVRTACRDVRCVAIRGYQLTDVRVVVAFVLTHVLRMPRLHFRPFYRNAFDRLADQAFVVNISAADRQAYWDTLPVGQQRPLGANFAPIRGVFAGLFTPQRSFGHGTIHGLPLPLDPMEFVVFLEGSGSKILKDTVSYPRLKIAVQGTARTKFRRSGLPLTTGPQHVKDSIKNPAKLQSRPPTFPASPVFRQQRFYPLPKLVRDPPCLRNLFPFHPCAP